MINSLLSRLHGQSQAVQQPPAAPPLHSQVKAPKLNQLRERTPHAGVANSLIKAGSKFTGMFRARQRDVGKHEQREWHDDLMRVPRDGKTTDLQMVNSSSAHAITQKLNAEGRYKDIRAINQHHLGPGVKGYQMKDQDGHYHQVQQSDAVISTLKSSMPQGVSELIAAGKGHQAESSGIFTDKHNVQHTLHNRTLYTFDRATQRWAQAQPLQNNISRLSLDQRGEMIKYLLKGDIRDHSAIKSHEVQLKRDGKIRLTEGTDPEKGVELSLLKHDSTPIDVQRVGLLKPSYSHGSPTLFVLDNEGGLHHKLLNDDWQSKATMTLQAVKPSLNQAIGTEAADKAAIEGFIADAGTLKAVIRDGVGLRHSAPLIQPMTTSNKDEPTQCRMGPGWRLSEQMHLVNQNGLPERIDVDDTQVRLHGGAALGLNKTRDLCGWNETTQSWDKLHVHGVTQLLRGLDDKPYVIQDGKPKVVDASFAQPKLKLGNGEPVALGRSTAAEVGRTLSEEKVSHCAVLDDKNFALLTEATPAKLKASIEGLNVDIPFPRDAQGKELAVTSVALDQSRHLYVTAGGNLYRLPHDQWTQSHHGETAAWKPAGLQTKAPSAPAAAAVAAPAPAPVSATATAIAMATTAATASATPGAPGTPPTSRIGNPISPGITDPSRKDGTDVLLDQVKKTLAPGISLSAADLSRATVSIGKVEIGPNKRPVIEATLLPPSTTDANGQTVQPGPSNHSLELSYGRLGEIVLRPAKAQANPTANSHMESMQARNHKTAKIGNANGSSTTTMFGSTTDNVRIGGAKNIFKTAAEGFRKMGESYQHHFHPLETPKANTKELKQAFNSGENIKQKLQAAGHHALTPGPRSRSGMSPIYQESLRLYKRFDRTNTNTTTNTNTNRTARPMLEAGIALLESKSVPKTRADQEKAQLHTGLKTLHKDIEDSSYQAIVRLGQIHKLLDERGKALEPAAANVPAAAPGAGTVKATGAVKVMQDALLDSGLSPTSKAQTKLEELIQLGLTLPVRQLEPGYDNTGRNESKSSLLEDRVLLDAQTLLQVRDLLGQVHSQQGQTQIVNSENVAPGKSTTLDQLQGLRMAYENSDIKLFSDNGIVSHRQLEKLHQARDTVARELTGRHGLNYNTTRSFSEDLRAIGDHFGNLQVGDATSLLRSKGATLTTPAMFVPLTPDGGGIYFNFGAGREHGISLETEGGEEATTLGLKNSHSTNEFLNVGYYHGPSAVFARLFSSEPKGNPSSGGELYSADASLKLTQSRAVAGWLTASNASMANVMENLLDPSASLADLYRLGQDKGGSVEASKVNQQTLGAGIGVDLGRLNLGGTLLRNESGGVWNAFLRATAGINAEATLLSNSKSTVTTHKGEGADAVATKRAFEVLPSASAGAYARVGLATNGNVHPDQTANNMGVNNHILIGQTVLPDALSVSFALDRAKNDKFTLNFKPGKAVTTPQLHDVEKSLGKVLKDKEIAKALAERKVLLTELERCAPEPAQASATLPSRPLGGRALPPTVPPRPARERVANLRELLPRLNDSMPKNDDVDSLHKAIASLPAAPTQEQRNKVLSEARTLAVAMKANIKATENSKLLEKAGKAIEAGEKVADLDGHLAALKGLVNQLDNLPHDNERLQELRYNVQQLVKNNDLSKTGGRLLASGEHKFTNTGLQLRKGGLVGDSAPWRDRTSTQNANAIATFINKSPVLQEMARRAEHSGPTSIEVTLELKPKVLESIENSLNTQDPDIQKKLEEALRNDDNVRIKRFTLLRGATQTDAKALPSPVFSPKSSASVTDSVVLASLDLKYSQEEEHRPISMTPGGLLVRPLVDKSVRDDMNAKGYVIKGSRNKKDLHSEEDVGRAKPGETTVEHSSNSANTGSGPRSTGAL
ncbi:AvrE-family type 3 secretion system effector [Pseudomonas moraviensis]|uniref:AvrE-family type 3 secretion system effector n=1 Tax=Pseudomonas moraviensis TaxID=321662 RepID=UPI00135D69D8|nr:AvrE-family type 3 secretion system effector [Pseudomonas moraviensis]MXI45766.1 AvrE-family type 3 secretion system effector [Pseudomonas moraviensis]